MMTEATRELRKQRTILGVLERAKNLLEQQGKRYVTIERMRGIVIVLTYDDNGKMWGKDVNLALLIEHTSRYFLIYQQSRN